MKLKIDNLSNFYLKNISFELNDENLVILGFNGSGKTTLAKSIVNLLENSQIYIDNILVSKLKNREKLLNFTPSYLDIFDEYIIVEEFLNLNLNINSNFSILEILEALDILYLKNRYLKALSSGEAQLILFASAILQNAYFSIFDEPTANLDSSKNIKIYNMLNSFKNFKIVITHDINLAYKLNYRTIFMQNGEIIYDGVTLFENLELIFGNSIKRVNDYFVINYK